MRRSRDGPVEGLINQAAAPLGPVQPYKCRMWIQVKPSGFGEPEAMELMITKAALDVMTEDLNLIRSWRKSKDPQC
jgi:hypothetical protein